jgi:hypothetical protein
MYLAKNDNGIGSEELKNTIGKVFQAIQLNGLQALHIQQNLSHYEAFSTSRLRTFFVFFA